MKKLTIALFLLCSIAANAQKLLTFEEVVKVDSIQAHILFERARGWFVATFKDSKSVLEVSDKESGELKGKGSMTAAFKSAFRSDWGYLSYTISVSVKDGRYKLLITDYENHYTPLSDNDKSGSVGLLTDAPDAPKFNMGFASKATKDNLWNTLKADADANSKRLSESLKKAMIISSEKSDW